MRRFRPIRLHSPIEIVETQPTFSPEIPHGQRPHDSDR